MNIGGETSAPDDRRRMRGARSEFAAAIACAITGILLSTLPNLLWWPELGRPIWFRIGSDDLFFLSLASWAYHDHPTQLGDRILDAGSSYPSLQFIPAILSSRALGLGPLGIYYVWKIWIGLSLGLGWYLIIRYYFRRPWVAASLATIFLCNVGLFHHSSEVFFLRSLYPGEALPTVFSGTSHLFKQVLTCSRLVRGKSVGDSVINDQFRFFTPGGNLAFLLLYLWLMARARDMPIRPRLVGAGLAFGLLFYVYFWYWTAAALGLLLAMALDVGYRRVYFHIGWIGGLVGLPWVVSSYLFKRFVPPDAFHRINTFLPIPRFSELLIPKLPILLAIVGLIWVWYRRRDLIHLWALATAGLLLLNHQLLTGLQIQNDHWRRAFDPAFALLFLLIAAGDILNRRPLPKGVAWGLLAVSGFYFGTGLWFRALEAELPNHMADYRKYETQRLGGRSVALNPESVVAGDSGFLYFAGIFEDQRPLFGYVVAHCPSITHDELNVRSALNSYLLGLDRAQFESQQKTSRGVENVGCSTWGPWARDPVQRAEMISRRVDAYDRIAADPPDALVRFGVRYVALPSEQSPPAFLNTTSWKCLQSGPYWQVWEYGL